MFWVCLESGCIVGCILIILLAYGLCRAASDADELRGLE